MGFSASAALPPFRDLVRDISPALPDPSASETLDGLNSRGVSHNVLDFLKMGPVELKCGYRAGNLTAFDVDAKSCRAD